MGVYLGSDDYVVELGAASHLNMNNDIELALRFTTQIKNGDEFFTDLNGFQVIRLNRSQKDVHVNEFLISKILCVST